MSRKNIEAGGARIKKIVLAVSLGLLSAGAFFTCPPPVGAYQSPALDRGRARMAHGDYDGAINSLGEALGMNDKDATAYLLRGECFFKMSNYKLAIQDLNNAIQYAPNNVRAYLVRGSCHANMGEDDSAVADYEDAIKLDPQLGQRFFHRGGPNFGGGNGNGGGGRFANGAGGGANGPRRGRMRRNGQTRISADEGNANGLNLHAIADYKQAMRIVYPNGLAGGAEGTAGNDGNAPDRDDTQSNPQVNGGGANADGGANSDGGPRRRRRRQAADQAMDSGAGGSVGGALNPKQTDAQNNAGIEAETAIPNKSKRFVKGLDQDPNRGAFGVIPGAGEFQGDAQKAVTDFTEVIRNNPNDPAPYYQRAKAMQKLGRVDDALKDYNQAIQRDPQKSQYYIGRASVFYQLGKTLLSEEEIAKARAVDPDIPGVVRFDLPKYPSSIKWSAGDGPGGH